MEINNMAKKIKSSDTLEKINDTTLHELLLMMDARLKHIEDISADNRDIIIKLVKQGNQIVEFLKSVEMDDITDEYFEDSLSLNMDFSESVISPEKYDKLKFLLEEFNSKKEELKEFEKELKKCKDMLTPGQVGES
jgi:hypothetical protein